VSVKQYPLFERLGSMLDTPDEIRGKSGVFAKPIKESHGTVAHAVAAQHGVEVVSNGFRCPPNRANGGTFTDAMGTTCGVMIAVGAVEDALEAAGQALNGQRALEGREGGKSAAILAKNEEILGAIKEAGGSPFDITREFAEANQRNGSIFHVATADEMYTKQRESTSRFLGHVRKYLATGEEPTRSGFGNMPSGWRKSVVDGLHPDVKDLIVNSTDEELLQIIEGKAFEFHQGVSQNVRVQIPAGHRLDAFIESGRYLTTHEAKSDHSDGYIRADYERQIGFPIELDAALRPASGYITHPDWEQVAADLYTKDGEREVTDFSELSKWSRGQVAIYGSVEVILRPEVSDRTGYGAGDSISTMLRPAKIGETDKSKVFSALMSQGGKSDDNVSTLALGFLEANRTGSFKNLNAGDGSNPDFVDTVHDRFLYFEALIAGSFGTEDVAAIRIAYRDLAKDTRGLSVEEQTKNIVDEFFSQQMLEKMGFSEEEIQYILGMLSNYKNYSSGPNIPYQFLIPQIEKLLEFRLASERKKMIEAKGIAVQVTHDKNLDPFEVTNYGGAAGDSIEQILMNRIIEALPKRVREDRERQAKLAAEQAERAARGEEEPQYG
jgi:hypothetical protein